MLQSKIEIKKQIKSLEDEQRKDKAILHTPHHEYNEQFAKWVNKIWETRKVSWWNVKQNDPDYMPDLGTIQNRCQARSLQLFIMNCAWYAVKHRLSAFELELFKEKVRKSIAPNKGYLFYTTDYGFNHFWVAVKKLIDEWTSNILRELDERNKVSE